DLEQLLSDYNTRRSDAPLTITDMELLRAVVAEFQEELKMLGYSVIQSRGVTAWTTPGDRRSDLGGESLRLDGSIESMARQRLLTREGPSGGVDTGDERGMGHGSADLETTPPGR